ncbi:MAG: PQQ-binding-like beta-propeller repeat protein [Planctomycetaceae bacterium]|nr:PQQ-binding-like beta-propeller repeat protein [Planctomycetaceae bacterium]
MASGRYFACLIWVAFQALAPSADAQSNWPQFRGAQSLGTSDDARLPERWTATENVRWKQDIPGSGWSSPVVWGNRVFVTTVVNRGTTEKPKKGLYLGGERPEPPKEVHEWRVVCLDLNDGQVLWNRQVHEGVPESSIHVKNTFASETPVTDGERVYAYFGNLGVYCLTVEGEPVWSQRWPVYKTNSGWGTGGSPILHADKLLVLNDNEESSFLVALDKRTGKELWRTPRTDKSGWSTPFVWTNPVRSEIVVSGDGKVRSYDLDGQVLWEVGNMSHNAIPTPFAQDGLLYVTSGHVLGKFKPLLAIRPGAQGDITLADGATSNDYVAWCQKAAAPYNPTPVLYDGRIYVCLDGGFFACYDAKSGEQIYSKKRIPNGKAFTASPFAYHNKIFCLNEDGVTFVIPAKGDFEILYTNPLADDDMCLATPGLADGKLLIRTAVRLYCIESTEVKKTAAAP